MTYQSTCPAALRPVSPSVAILAGFCASLVAVGLARFAYTPLLPALIGAHWFAPSDAVYLGAANFVGYFAGSLAGRPLGECWGRRLMLQSMMALASVSFVACAAPLSLLWYFAWRFLSGFAGAVVMVLVAQTILPAVAPARRGLASGAIFMGIGGGIMVAGTLVPMLLQLGLQVTWLALALGSTILTLLTWHAWPAAQAPAAAPASAAAATPACVRWLYGAYAAVAIGLVPTAVFLVDYIARGLARGSVAGGLFWVLYGAGALAGPLLYGWLADRTGFGVALRTGLLLSALASLLLASWADTPALVAASLLLGAFTPGVVTLMIGRLHELLPADYQAQHVAWGHSTTFFALFQAAAGYLASFVFARSGGQHALLFWGGALAFALALLLELAGARSVRRRG